MTCRNLSTSFPQQNPDNSPQPKSNGSDPVDFLVNLDHFQVHHPEIVSSQVSKDFAGQLTSNPQNIDLWEKFEETSEKKKGR